MLGAYRILDLTWVLGGPFAGQLLAQLGADVIKIETLDGDLSRVVPPHFFEGDSSFFLAVNRGKKSVAIDLKLPEGKAAFYDLVREADAVVYGFAPDVPKRLGIDFDSLKTINPRICVAELIGLHDEGEYARAPAYDLIVQAMGGVMSITGEAGRPPARVGYQIGDLAAGLYLALGVCSGLLKAKGSGEGGHVQISLLDCQLALLTWQAQNYFISGEVPVALGSRSPMISPSEAFRCSDGRYLAISPTGDHFWREFCVVIGRPDMNEDPRYAKRPARVANLQQLAAELADIFAQRPAKEWEEKLFAARIPASVVLNVPEAVDQPVARMRAMVETLPNAESGKPMRFLGNPFKYEGAAPLSYPPAHGAATREIFRDVCRYDDSQIDDLIEKRALYAGGE